MSRKGRKPNDNSPQPLPKGFHNDESLPNPFDEYLSRLIASGSPHYKAWGAARKKIYNRPVKLDAARATVSQFLKRRTDVRERIAWLRESGDYEFLEQYAADQQATQAWCEKEMLNFYYQCRRLKKIVDKFGNEHMQHIDATNALKTLTIISQERGLYGGKKGDVAEEAIRPGEQSMDELVRMVEEVAKQVGKKVVDAKSNDAAAGDESDEVTSDESLGNVSPIRKTEALP